MPAPRPLIYYYDDEALMRAAIARLISRLVDAEVVLFDDVDKFMHRAVEEPPNLLITDMFHPGPTGDEMVRRLKRSASTRGVPIWILSGRVDECRERATTSGADFVLGKPASAAALSRELETLFHLPPINLFELDVEAPDFDVKLRLEDTADGWARLAKDVIALANFGGGQILFGKRDEKTNGFDWVGVAESELPLFEVTRLNRALARYMAPPIHVAPRRFMMRGLHFVSLTVPPGEDLILASRDFVDASLYCGRIYVRTAAAETSEARTSVDVRRVVDRLVAARIAGGARGR